MLTVLRFAFLPGWGLHSAFASLTIAREALSNIGLDFRIDDLCNRLPGITKSGDLGERQERCQVDAKKNGTVGAQDDCHC